LKRNPGVAGEREDPFDQVVVGDHASVVDEQRRPAAERDARAARRPLLREVSGNARFEIDDHVGPDAVAQHGSAAHSDFLLNRARHIHGRALARRRQS